MGREGKERSVFVLFPAVTRTRRFFVQPTARYRAFAVDSAQTRRSSATLPGKPEPPDA